MVHDKFHCLIACSSKRSHEEDDEKSQKSGIYDSWSVQRERR